MKHLLSFLILWTLTACGSLQNSGLQTAQGPASDASSKQTELADDTHWRIDINSMNTLRYGSKMVTPDFFLQMRGDSLRSYLPYLGNAFRSSYGDTDGVLDFDLPVRNLQVAKTKKHVTRLEMDIHKTRERFHVVVELEDDGRAVIRVSSNDRDPISFDGNRE